MTATVYLDSLRTAYPDLSSWFEDMANLYENKLWHQLTVTLETFLSSAVAHTGDLLIQLYHNFISEFDGKINQLKLAHFAVTVSRQYKDSTSAITFLEKVIEKLNSAKKHKINEPALYVTMQIAALKLQRGDRQGCKVLLEEAKVNLVGLTDVDPTIHSSVHWVSSQYYKSLQDFAEFYRSTLLYLSYTPAESLSEPFKMDLVVDLSLAALLGDGVYNFGELITHPILKVLENSSFGWLHELLVTFDKGDLYQYDDLCAKYAAELNSQPSLVTHEKALREKITILSLLQLIFSRPSDDRTIALSVIAEKTKLTVEAVEFLLMKTLSVHLIEGFIDQVEGTIQVTWVQPKVLGPEQIASLDTRLENWLSRVHSTVLSVEAETPDLLVA